MLGIALTDYPCNVHFQISIFVKDGRYKYEFSNFVEKGEGKASGAGLGPITTAENYPKKMQNGAWQEDKTYIKSTVTAMIERLKETMAKTAKKDDW